MSSSDTSKEKFVSSSDTSKEKFVSSSDTSKEKAVSFCAKTRNSFLIKFLFQKKEYCASKTVKTKFATDVSDRGLFIGSPEFADHLMRGLKWEINFFPSGVDESIYPGAKDGQTSLELVYKGASKIRARFVVQIIQSYDEFYGKREPKIQKKSDGKF